jgi:hypothetical protein
MSTIDGSSAAGESCVHMTIPRGWCIVHVEQLLDGQLARLISGALGDDRDAPETVALDRELRQLDDAVVQEGLVCMAMRRSTDEQRTDVLTLAVLRTVRGRPLGMGVSRGRVANRLEHDETVALPDQDAVMYLSQASAAEADKRWPARVQILRSLRGCASVAILTMLSTKTGVEQELASDARKIATSIGHSPAELATGFHAE